MNKIYPADIEVAIQEHGTITAAALAAEFGVNVDTVRKHVRALRQDGTQVLHSSSGYHIPNGTYTADEARVGKGMCKWVIGQINGSIRVGNNIRPLLKESRRTYLDLTKEERRDVRDFLLTLGRVMDAVEIDEELGLAGPA